MTDPAFDDDDSSRIAAAEAALAALADTYFEAAQEPIARLNALARGTLTRAAADEIYRIAHDFKGQGATFGYDLLTQIGASLCARMKAHGSNDPATLAPVIARHADAFAAVGASAGLKGTGGAEGQRILKALAER